MSSYRTSVQAFTHAFARGQDLFHRPAGFDTVHVFRKLGPDAQLYVCAIGTRPANCAPQTQILAETRELESRFRNVLGTKVNLYRSRRGGRLVIHFYSEEELGAIYDAIVGSGDL